ncbi:MAG TPA: hypothetical protein VIT41_09700 [Microlunatus sp.]
MTGMTPIELGIGIAPAANRVYKEFTDGSGRVVRTISAGRGSTLSFTHVLSGATVGLKSNGSVMKATINPDGSSTVSATGHNVIILFPTDVPAVQRPRSTWEESPTRRRQHPISRS